MEKQWENVWKDIKPNRDVVYNHQMSALPYGIRLLIHTEKYDRQLHLRKSRSRMVMTALRKGIAEHNNLRIMQSSVHPEIILFAYRGTDVLGWDTRKDEVSNIFADAWEDSPATFNQRKLAKEAIGELRKSIVELMKDLIPAGTYS
jgi:hypothetical protein